MRKFKNKYSKNTNTKKMRSRKRVGGLDPPNETYEPINEINTDPVDTANSVDTVDTVDTLDTLDTVDTVDNSNMDNAIMKAEAEEVIDDGERDIQSQANVESIENQANKLFVSEIVAGTPQIWNEEQITEKIRGEYRKIRILTHLKGQSSRDSKNILRALHLYEKKESKMLGENKKNYLEAITKYKNKRTAILTALKKQPNRLMSFMMSTKRLENIIEKALQNSEEAIPNLRNMVNELVRTKFEMKKAKNNLDRSKYIVGVVEKAFANQTKIYSDHLQDEAERIDNARNSNRYKDNDSSSYEIDHNNSPQAGSDVQDPSEPHDNSRTGGGGSKKRTTSKRHIKRQTKRHKQNNKRRYTKKRR